MSREELERIKALLVPVYPPEHRRAGEPDHVKFLAQLVRLFGSVAGLQLKYHFHNTGLSTWVEGGWYVKNREQGCEETGQGHREWDAGKATLLGKKPWAGRKVKVLEERRPSRRAPAEYRVDLMKLAEVLGVEVPSADDPDEDLDLDDIPPDDDLLEDEAAESPREATPGEGEVNQ